MAKPKVDLKTEVDVEEAAISAKKLQQRLATGEEKSVPKSISLPPRIWDVLRDVSYRRKRNREKPATISAIIQAAIENILPELEKENRNNFK